MPKVNLAYSIAVINFSVTLKSPFEVIVSYTDDIGNEKIQELMQKFGRNRGAIVSRLNKIGFDLDEKY